MKTFVYFFQYNLFQIVLLYNSKSKVEYIPEISRFRPPDAVLYSGLCGKGGALPSVTGQTVQRIICCLASYW